MELVVVVGATSGTEKKPGQACCGDFLSALLGAGWSAAVLIFAEIFLDPCAPVLLSSVFLATGLCSDENCLKIPFSTLTSWKPLTHPLKPFSDLTASGKPSWRG